MRIDDYTRLPIGMKVESGEIKACPHCDLHGLAELISGTLFFTHYQAVGFDEKGTPVMKFYWCPKGPKMPHEST